MNAFSGVDNEVDVVEVATNQTIRVGAVSGSIAFRGPESGLVVVDSLAADAHVRLLDGVRLQVNAVGAGADVVLGAADDTASGSWHLYGPDNGTPVWLPISETVPGGRIVYGGRLVLNRSWTAKAALWLDATASDSITYLRDVNADTTSVGSRKRHPLVARPSNGPDDLRHGPGAFRDKFHGEPQFVC